MAIRIIKPCAILVIEHGFILFGRGNTMTRQAGEYYLASDDLVFARSIRRIKAF